MIKPRGKVIYQGKSPGTIGLGATGIRIGAWCPDEKAEAPPEQVHLHFTVEVLGGTPMILRFKSPDTLGFLIEELERYRRYVWPDAEPVNLEEKDKDKS